MENRPLQVIAFSLLAAALIAVSIVAAQRDVSPSETEGPATEAPLAVVVDQGFTLVQETRLTYAFFVRPAQAGMALDGADYRVSFYGEAGALVYEREAPLPLLLPGGATALAEENLRVEAVPVSMTVEVIGGVLLPAPDLPLLVPAGPIGFSGGGGTRSMAEAILWNPFPEPLAGATVTVVYFDSQDGILGGKSEVSELPPGRHPFDFVLRFAPSEESDDGDRPAYIPPRVEFYFAPAPGALSDLLAMREEPDLPPRGAPLLVYETEDPDYGSSTHRLFAVDRRTGERHEVVQFGNDRDESRGAALSGSFLYYATSSHIERLGLDGSGTMRMFETTPDDPSVIQDFDLSPDGALIALVTAAGEREDFRGYLLILDASDGREVARFERRATGFDALGRAFVTVDWRDDGAGVFIGGSGPSPSPFRYATVLLGGAVTLHGFDGNDLLAPDARRTAYGPSFACGMLISTQSLRLRDLDSGAETIIAEEETKLFTRYRWSPDGSELLYQERDLPQDPECNAAVTWRLWSGGTSVLVDDLNALADRWYGDLDVHLLCDGAAVPLWEHDFIHRDEVCPGDPEAAGQLIVDGQPVGEIASRIWLLGFAEEP